MLLLFFIIISINTPLEYPHIADRWFSFPHALYIWPIPLLVPFLAYGVFKGLEKDRDRLPFRCAIGIFFTGLYWHCGELLAEHDYATYHDLGSKRSTQLAKICDMGVVLFATDCFRLHDVCV